MDLRGTQGGGVRRREKPALKAEERRLPEERLRRFGTTARCVTLGVIRETFPQVNDLAGEPSLFRPRSYPDLDTNLKKESFW